ncbi:CRISPR-associated protein Csa3 [Halalkaliarchaeum desulfuricum]|uniref:CRISPR-associated protein Csa3 n=1 Tax=Halalkaliarchaeum desulfuricum TaxID=2055893 RepID=A0A343TGH5_9EURY|nr:CRISPR-associated CARF protein Csa3 [Halalkaliarchaeum desulfuricum]AUX08197.1 CRISPR-associated protein Csa3 [Halalkaliarchaeum desulfuricum]
MRTYVSTLGFHETRVTRPVIKHGIDDGDRVVLVRPASEGNTDRARDAVGYVEDMVEEIAPDASVSTERVDTSEFTTTVLQCSDVLNAVDDERDLIVNFGGGAREVLLPFMIAAVLYAPSIDGAFQYTDVDQEVRTVSIPHLTAQIPRSAVATFDLIAEFNEEIALPELARESDQSKSTVSRHVDDLAGVEVVDTRFENNTKYVCLSQTGRLLRRSE